MLTWCIIAHFILQARAYARNNHGEKQEMDRSSVLELSKPSHPFTDLSNTSIPFLCIFLLSNVLMLTLTLLNLCKLFHWYQKQEKLTKSVYKASAIVLTCINVIALVVDIVNLKVAIINSLEFAYKYTLSLNMLVRSISSKGITSALNSMLRNTSCLLLCP